MAASAAAQPEAATGQPFLLHFTNAASETAGIGRLSATGVPSGATEIRIWVGFGMIAPDYMLRIRVDESGAATGDLWLSFDSDLSYIEDTQERQRYLRELSRDCVKLIHGDEAYVCRAIMRKQPDWAAMYRRLVSLGVMTLPDESALPQPKHTISDGSAMVVEIRSGENYRAYEYSNPGFRDEPEAKAAAQISDAVGEIIQRSGRKG